MAGPQERNDSYRIIFRYRGKQRTITLGKVGLQEAEAFGRRSPDDARGGRCP
jgi:hypothetical protein